MKLKAKFNSVIIEPVELEGMGSSHIVIPDFEKESNKIGRILDVGPGKYSITGEFIKNVSKVGEIVILPTMGFGKFFMGNNTYYVGPENDLLGTIEDAKIKE
jgi:co-chaperonin GroES (HSP10)